MAVVFATAVVGFIVHERRARNPVVNFALFRIRMFTFSVLSLLVISTASSVLMLLLPFYMQDVLHQSASFMGLVFLAAPVFTISLAPLTGHLTDRIGPRLPTGIGVLMTTGAVLVGTLLRTDSHWALPAALMAFMGLGQGFFNPANQMALIGAVPREYRGFATGMVQMIFGLGSLLGTALGSVLLTVMFRYASGLPDAAPNAQQAGPFVFAMNATCAACLVLMAVAFVASLLRGPTSAR
jgi:MFS family permease